MEKLKANHVYLAKNLPIKKYSLFSSEIVDKVKDIQKIIVREVTSSCYLISFIEKEVGFYVEQNDKDIVYLEDLGIIAK